VDSIWSLFHFPYNQPPMKIVFTSSYKTYFKDNTKLCYKLLCFSFLKCDFFFVLIIWDGGSTIFSLPFSTYSIANKNCFYIFSWNIFQRKHKKLYSKFLYFSFLNKCDLIFFTYNLGQTDYDQHEVSHSYQW